MCVFSIIIKNENVCTLKLFNLMYFLFYLNIKNYFAVVTCGSPGTIANGRVDGSNYNYGNSVTYSCNQHYNMSGSYKQMCQNNEIWSGSKPTCICKYSGVH